EGKEYDALLEKCKSYERDIKRLEEQQRSEEARKAHLAAPATKPVDLQVTREEGMDDKGNIKVFRSFGEQLQAVSKAARFPQRMDEKLVRCDRLTRAASGLNETVDGDGGFLLQPDFSSEILRRAYETGIVARQVRRLGISANANTLNIPIID